MQQHKESSNARAGKMLLNVFLYLVYIAIAAYGDIMFLGVLNLAFPNQYLRIVAMVGAVGTAACVIVMPLVKKYILAPGLQYQVGIAFWALEILALALNSMLAYQLSLLEAYGTPLDGAMAFWRNLSPATPFIALIGIGLITMLDPSHKLRHAQAELESRLVEIQANQILEMAESVGVQQAVLAGSRVRVSEAARQLGGSLPVFEQEEPETYEVADQPRPRAKPASKPARARDTGMSLIHKAQEVARRATAPNGSNGSDTENYPT